VNRVLALLLCLAAGACADATGPALPAVSLQAIHIPDGIAVGAVAVTDSTGVASVWVTFTSTASHADTILNGASFAALLYPDRTSQAAWQSVPPGWYFCEEFGHCALALLLIVPAGATRAVLAGRLAELAVTGSDGVHHSLVPGPPAGRYTAAAIYNDGSRYHIVVAGPVVCRAAGCAN